MLVIFRGDENFVLFEQFPIRLREGRMAVTSLISSAVEAKDFLEGVKAPGNAVGSAREKLPCPSFRNIATG
jgi:hypothetical protein